VVEAARPLLEGRGHQLHVSLPSEAMVLHADPTRIEQVISNLLNNAIKYTDEGGQVWLTAYREDARAVIKVKDTGIGIDAKTLAQVFELFKQAERTLDRSQGGLGLGLTLVKRLVELHGGTVEAASEGVGKGSEVTVRLPLAAAEVASQVCRPEARSPATPPLRVLVVDDNRDAAETMKMVLGLNGHEVRTAHDGLSAISRASHWRPDVVLLDIGLPRLDGYEVGRRLRARPDMKDVVIIAVTGYGQDSDRRRSEEAGFQYHLVKPVAPQ
jgi:CheY-like chemotaxis protein/anti-sigma regulatory factor (Ser/Thr protein kinase)